ncbi:hypothetical protein, partial [Thiolapillus sp.]|uniref:hypothetical protein n=1 Tax=Thiolapillus sp. TaxID=2017437 RepID=UPI003AF8A441
AGCSNQRIEQALTGSMNKIATLFHPKIYGGTMLLTLNSSTISLSSQSSNIFSSTSSGTKTPIDVPGSNAIGHLSSIS